jgi:hypothetical protein
VKKLLDLRRSLRITLAEGRLLMNLLENAAGREAKSLRHKLGTAITIADHACVAGKGGVCAICNANPDDVAKLRKYRADNFQETLRRSREEHLRRKPSLKIAK